MGPGYTIECVLYLLIDSVLIFHIQNYLTEFTLGNFSLCHIIRSPIFNGYRGIVTRNNCWDVKLIFEIGSLFQFAMAQFVGKQHESFMCSINMSFFHSPINVSI